MATYYDSIADGYNELHGEEQLRKLRAAHAYLIQHGLLSQSDTILDVGCGTGLSARVFASKITGVEPAARLARQAPFQVKVCAGERLPFPDKSFDIVICMTALHNFTDAAAGLKEMARVGRKAWVVSVLRKAKNAKLLTREVRKTLSVVAEIEDETDVILCAEKLRQRRTRSF